MFSSERSRPIQLKEQAEEFKPQIEKQLMPIIQAVTDISYEDGTQEMVLIKLHRGSKMVIRHSMQLMEVLLVSCWAGSIAAQCLAISPISAGTR